MFKKTAIVAGISLALSATAQADYNFEAGVAIGGGDANSIGIDGRYFIGGVDDSKGPYGEAAFLDHASSIGIGYAEAEPDGSDDIESEAYGIDGRYVTEGQGWIFDAGYIYTEVDPGGAEIDTYNVGFGKYLTDTTSLVVSYQNQDVDNVGDVDSYRLDIDHMFLFGEGGGLKLHGAYGFVDVEDQDDIDIYEIDATWYVCKNLGIGALYSTTDQLGDELETYGAFGEYFITESVSVGLAYAEGELQNSDLEVDSYIFNVNIRL